jgi:uncharacterized protein Smg (DUF494 family)
VHERIVEIILFLINELRLKKQLHDVDISSLTRDGYTKSEISSAFSWLYYKITLNQSITGIPVSESTSQRMLNDHERMIINIEAYGYLVQCQQLGILSNTDTETIIDRILAANIISIGLTEMKSIVAGYLFDIDFSGGNIIFGIDDLIH